MNATRRQSQALLRSSPTWVRAPKAGGSGNGNLATQTFHNETCRLFAVVRPPDATGVRQVLVFDNHPETLALLFASEPEHEATVSESELWPDWLFATAMFLMVLLLGAILWLLLFR